MPSKHFVKLDWFDDMVESEDDIYCVILTRLIKDMEKHDMNISTYLQHVTGESQNRIVGVVKNLRTGKFIFPDLVRLLPFLTEEEKRYIEWYIVNNQVCRLDKRINKIMATLYKTLKGAPEPELPSTLQEEVKPLTPYQKKKRRALNRYWVEQAWIKGL